MLPGCYDLLAVDVRILAGGQGIMLVMSAHIGGFIAAFCCAPAVAVAAPRLSV
jgi:hypothetical protein